MEPAAREYFGKSAANLNVAEAALLAALPKAPSSYNPRRFPERALARRNLVIDLLRRSGDLTVEAAAAWKRAPLGLVAEDSSRIVAPYFVDYVRLELEQRFGDVGSNPGDSVYTTLDLVLQGFALRWASTLTFIFVVGLVFYFVPNAKVRFRDVWVGAIVTGLAWRAALAGFSFYVRDLGRFSVHGSIAAVVVFLVWVYTSAVILLYGVEVTAAYARLRRRRPEEIPAAPAPRL